MFDKTTKTPRRVKTPTVLQMEAVECGAAALSIILSYYGRYVSLAELRIACGVSRDGSKALNINKAAKQYGLEARAFQYTLEDVKQLQPPFIVFWEFNHFLVVEGFKHGQVFLNDPALGPRKVSEAEFSESYTGIVQTFKPGENFKPGGQKPTFIPTLAKRLRGQKTTLIFLILTGLGLIVPGILLPVFSKIFIDGYLVNQMHEWLMPLLWGLFLTALIRGALEWLQSYFLLRFRMKLSLTSSSQFLWHVLHLPVIFFSQRSTGDIAQRMSINNQVAQLLADQLIETILNLITVTFFIILMLVYSYLLTAICLAFAVINLIILRLTAHYQININKSLSVDWGKLFGISMNGLQMIETYKAMGAEDDLFARWSGQFAKVSNAQQKAGIITLTLEVFSVLISNVNVIVIIGIGAYLVINGEMTIGTLVAFQTLLISFSKPFSQLVSAGSLLQQLHGNMNRLDDVMSYPRKPEVVVPNILSAAIAPKLSGNLTIKNLNFGYSILEPPFIKDFSLNIEAGQRIAIVGRTNSGRSSIVRLILGLYQPWSGQILFDGKTIQQIDPCVFSNSVGMVSDESRLFEGSVSENITLWDSSIDNQSMIRAAKDAAIHTVISSRINTYDALLTENGSNFSGGERQRLEIARALAINPSLLILDEATSALDPPVEEEVMNNIKQRRCTCLIVAQRLSSVRDCDQIVVMDSGQIVQHGTHEELINEKSGMYHMLANA